MRDREAQSRAGRTAVSKDFGIVVPFLSNLARASAGLILTVGMYHLNPHLGLTQFQKAKIQWLFIKYIIDYFYVPAYGIFLYHLFRGMWGAVQSLNIIINDVLS